MNYETPEYIDVHQALLWLAHGLKPCQKSEIEIWDLPKHPLTYARKNYSDIEFEGELRKKYLFGGFSYDLDKSLDYEKMARAKLYKLLKEECDSGKSGLFFVDELRCEISIPNLSWAEWKWHGKYLSDSDYDFSLAKYTVGPKSEGSTGYRRLIPPKQCVFSHTLKSNFKDLFLTENDFFVLHELENKNYYASKPFLEHDDIDEDWQAPNGFRVRINWDVLKEKTTPLSGKTYPDGIFVGHNTEEQPKPGVKPKYDLGEILSYMIAEGDNPKDLNQNEFTEILDNYNKSFGLNVPKKTQAREYFKEFEKYLENYHAVKNKK